MARCVCCPYPLVAIPGLLSYAALILTWIAALSCNFYRITYSDGSDLRVGLWTIESDYMEHKDYIYESPTCTGYGWRGANLYEELDSAMRTSRAFALISGILGIIALIMILIPSCVAFDESKNLYLTVLCGLCIFTGIATLLDLVALASDICTNATECTLQSAGNVAIAGGVLWFVIAGFLLVAIKNPRPLRQAESYFPQTTPVEQAPPPMEQQKEVTTAQNADGSTTKTTTTTVMNADGSKTVTQTIEMIPAETA